MRSPRKCHVIVDLNLDFTSFSFENDRSREALDVRRITPIFNTVNKLGNILNNPVFTNKLNILIMLILSYRFFEVIILYSISSSSSSDLSDSSLDCSNNCGGSIPKYSGITPKCDISILDFINCHH